MASGLMPIRPSQAVSSTPLARPGDLNARSLSRLQVETILADHRRYVDTERKEGARADFSFVELCGVRFAGLKLRRARFDHARLAGADFTGADLRKANLIGADLRGAKMPGADLTQARLSGANLSGADLEGVPFAALTSSSRCCRKPCWFVLVCARPI